MSGGRHAETAPPRLRHLTPDEESRAYVLDDRLDIGRRAGHIVVPDDEYMSGAHAFVEADEDGVVLHDRQSTNGTFVRIRGEIELRPGDEILVGGQVFRLVT